MLKAAYFGYVDIVRMLLRAGARVDQVDSHHKTPLYVVRIRCGCAPPAASPPHPHPQLLSSLLLASFHVALASRVRALDCVRREAFRTIALACAFAPVLVPMPRASGLVWLM